MGEQPGRGRLAVDAGDGDEGMRPFCPSGRAVDDGLAHGPRLAGGRLQVHAQARAGVDLDDGAALLLQRPADVRGHHVHAGDVQADARAASTARAATSGWTWSVTSVAVPPVLRLPLRRISTRTAGRPAPNRA